MSVLKAAFLVVAASIVAQSAFAQAESVRVSTGLSGWAQGSTVQMKLSGAMRVGSVVTQIEAELNRQREVSVTGTVDERVEIVEFIDGRLTQRIVADGQTLYAFSPARNEVQVSTYQVTGSATSRVFGRLGDGLAAVVEGHSTHLVRLYRDMFHSSGANFRSWMPGGTMQELNTVGVTPDPVNPNRRYTVTPTMSYYLSFAGNPPNRSLAFEFDSSSGTEKMNYAYYTEVSKIGSQQKVTDWKIAFTSPIMRPSLFEFIPPRNARMIAGPKISN